MALFRKRTPADYRESDRQGREVTTDDRGSSDGDWYRKGQARFEGAISNFYGSPESIADGGRQHLEAGDMACALAFFGKSIDLLHTLYCFGEMAQRRPSSRDELILMSYLEALSAIRQQRPSAPVSGSVVEVTHRLRTISSACEDAQLDPSLYLSALEQLSVIAPDVDVSGVFWRNPTMEETVAAVWQRNQVEPATSVTDTGPTSQDILAEWPLSDRDTDLAKWREGMQRYEAAPLEDRAAMRASAELMCPALAHFLSGENILPDEPDRGSEAELAQTIWNVLVASLMGNDKTTWGPDPERHVRLALAATRRGRYQSVDLGGQGALAPIFDDRGNRMLMSASLSSEAWQFHLGNWFTAE